MNDLYIKELQEKIKRLEILQHLNIALNQTNNPYEFLTLLLDNCIKLTNADAGFIILKDNYSDEIRFEVYQGFDKVELKKKIKAGEALAANLFTEGLPRIINDVTFDPFYVPLRDDIKSRLVTPIVMQNEIKGVLSVESTKRDAFNEGDLQLILNLRNMFSIIFSKINLYDQLERKVKLKDLIIEIVTSLEKSQNLDNIFEFVMKKLTENFGIIRGMLVTFEDEEFNLLSVKKAFNISEEEMQRGIYKVGEGVVGRVVETGKPISLEDIHKAKEFLNRMKIKRPKDIPISFIAVPVKIEGIVIGVLAVEKKFINTEILREDEEMLTIIANFIGSKIKNLSAVLKEKDFLFEENLNLKKELYKNYSFQTIIGKNKKMVEIFELIRSVADSDASILILGESGTGKELIAKAIHYESSRKNQPFVSINCAAIPETLLEAELFGYRKGAFTGAIKDKKGKFILANGGTLFLDEIGDMPLGLQAKILRALQEKEIEPLGSETKEKIDIRLISATNRPIEKWVEEGKFRKDLYYRINVIEIRLPPLRERKDDIPILVRYFLEKYAKKNRKKPPDVSEEAMLFLQNYSWPGNVRELENVLERAILLCKDDKITPSDLPSYVRKEEDIPELYISNWMKKILDNPAYEGKIFDTIMESIEKELISKTLLKFKRNQLRTAQALGINRNTLRSRMEKFGL